VIREKPLAIKRDLANSGTWGGAENVLRGRAERGVLGGRSARPVRRKGIPRSIVRADD